MGKKALACRNCLSLQFQWKDLLKSCLSWVSIWSISWSTRGKSKFSQRKLPHWLYLFILKMEQKCTWILHSLFIMFVFVAHFAESSTKLNLHQTCIFILYLKNSISAYIPSKVSIRIDASLSQTFLSIWTNGPLHEHCILDFIKTLACVAHSNLASGQNCTYWGLKPLPAAVPLQSAPSTHHVVT